MKTYDIAFKDLKRTLLSVFSLVMMFGAPLLIAGLLYFAFGGLTTDGSQFTLPATKVVVVSLDQPGTQNASLAAGEMLVQFLQDESLADVLDVGVAGSEAEARAAVVGQKAGVAVIIPPNLTAAVTAPERTAAVKLYQDPTLTIGPGIVKDLVSHFLDGFSGAKIAGQTAVSLLNAHGLAADASLALQTSQHYSAWLQAGAHGDTGATPRLAIVSPAGETQAAPRPAVAIGPIMAGMAVFFVFFIGANGAESIIREDEEGTLARLFMTPTSVATILSGKLLAMVVSLVLQVLLLLGASALLFNIAWGQPATVALVSLGLVVAATGFGVMLMSFIKTSRQTGPVLGGVMTLMGMVGGLMTTGLPNPPSALDRVSLFTPQGWALRGFELALAGATPGQVFLPVLMLLVLGVAFMAVGAALFRRRFA